MSKNSEARPRPRAQTGSIEFSLTMPLAALSGGRSTQARGPPQWRAGAGCGVAVGERAIEGTAAGPSGAWTRPDSRLGLRPRFVVGGLVSPSSTGGICERYRRANTRPAEMPSISSAVYRPARIEAIFRTGSICWMLLGLRPSIEMRRENRSSSIAPKRSDVRGGSRRRCGFCCVGPTAGFQPPALRLTLLSAERARSERRHPTASNPEVASAHDDPLENTIRRHQPSGVRKERAIADGLANVSFLTL